MHPNRKHLLKQIAMTKDLYWVSVLGYAVISLIILIKERKSGNRIGKAGYAFLLLVYNSLLFYVVDILWGLCYVKAIKSDAVFFGVSQMFHLLSAVTSLSWLFYILRYTGCRRVFRRILLAFGGVLLLVETVLFTLNFYKPILFRIVDGCYQRCDYALYTFAIQYIMFLIAGSITLVALLSGHIKGESRTRYWAVLFSSVVPLTLGKFQMEHNDAPYYSMGYMLSILILYVFVVTADRDELYQSKSLFLRNMSHEIRTSLNSVYGFAQLLGMPDGTWTEEEREKYNAHIYSNYNMLDLLLNDLIAYSKSDKMKFSVSMEEVNLLEVCKNTLSSFRFCKPKGVALSLKSDLPDDYTMLSDGKRIKQILLHMLANAVQYSTEGEVLVHIGKGTKGVEIAVIDPNYTMPGMAPQAKYLEGSLHDKATKRLGLRINLCQQVARLIGGRVYLDTHYNKGVRIAFIVKKVSGSRS